MSVIDTVLSAWRRRYWRGSSDGLERFYGLKPFTVITGASTGIGHAFATQCAGRGDNVLLIARNAERLEAVAGALRSTSRATVVVLALDVTQADAPALIATSVAQQQGYIDLLINNAGFGIGGAFEAPAAARLDAMVALNVAAPTRLMHAVLPDMLTRGAGGIINVSSLGGYGPGPWQAAYYASKAYVTTLSEAVAYETRGLGVRILAVAPGPVETGFHETMGSNSALYRTFIPAVSPEQVASSALRAYRLGWRVVLPGIVAPVLMLLTRVTPHQVTLPVLGMLLRVPPEGRDQSDA